MRIIQWLLIASGLCSLGCGAIFGFEDPVLVPCLGPCQLVAVQPSVANTDETIALEGNLGPDVTVNFPGGVSSAATVLGTNRATVAVPALATGGDLTIITGGGVLGPVPFRRASFPLGLQNFWTYYESSLTTARFAHTVDVVGGFLYVIGGSTASALRSVERARINADGSLGAFGPIPGVTLLVPRGGHTSLKVGNFLYVLGGSAGTGGVLDTVERASINADGSLGPFTTVTSLSLVTARYLHTTVVAGNSLYILGGAGASGTALSSIERATINADGTLGAFTAVSDSGLVAPRYGHTSIVVGRYVYVVGGLGNGILNSVERASINSDGSLGPFITVPGVALATARYQHTSVVLGNALYVVGGSAAGGILSSVERASINADDSLGGFVPIANITQATGRSGHATVLLGNFLYSIGGLGNTGYSSGLERASINASGSLGEFAALARVTLTTPRNGMTVVVGNSIYALGGGNSAHSKDVDRATVDAGGSLSVFTTVPEVATTNVRSAGTSAVIGNFLYLIGGFDPGVAGNYLGSVERATVNADGSIGAFATVSGISLITPRNAHTSVRVDNFVYVIGGQDGNGTIATVERAPINPDGSIGSFAVVSGVTLLEARSYHTTSVIRNFVYVVGGSGASGALDSIERAAINSDGSLGPFVPVSGIVLTTPRTLSASAVLGNSLYILGGLGGTSSASSWERTTIGQDGSLTPFTVGSFGSMLMYFGTTNAALGNFLYFIGGVSGPGTVLDITDLIYAANLT
jgi:Kelch motif protein